MKKNNILQIFVEDGEYRIIESVKNRIIKEKGTLTHITIDYINNSILAFYDIKE